MRLPIVIVVVVLAITLGVAGGFGLTSWVDRSRSDLGPGDVVRTYLQALADGDADTAVAMGATLPPDQSLMNDEVLKSAREHAPITEIKVTEVDGSVVRAEYRLGERPVTFEVTLVDTDRGPRLEHTWGLLRLAPVAGENLSKFVYGVEVTAAQTPVFPGVYPVQTGRELIDWGEDASAVVDRPAPFESVSTKLRPRLTEAGIRAFEQRTREFLSGCLSAKELAPKGCPFSVKPSGKAAPASVTWTAAEGDPMEDFEPRVDADNVLVPTARFDFTVVARWQQDGEPKNAARYVGGRATLDISDEQKPVFAWKD
ncbi:hypothetical protein [Enemella sp. A6]|uniref:hypothetical protein n=1 Tax=Enemella sp. A6 TaxID=3440152 RepID=UPI003EB769E9